MPFAVGNGDNGQTQAAQAVFCACFRYGHIEFIARFLLQTVGNAALGLEIVVAVQAEFHCEYCHEHGYIRISRLGGGPVDFGGLGCGACGHSWEQRKPEKEAGFCPRRFGQVAGHCGKGQ